MKVKNTEEIFEGLGNKPFSFREFYEDHKIGILGTLIFHMLLLMIFLIFRIHDYRVTQNLDVYIDFSQLEEKTPEQIAAEEKQKEEEQYYRKLLERQLNESNRAVNVSKDIDKKIDTKDYVKEVEKELEASRNADYLKEQEKIRKIMDQHEVVPVNTPEKEEKKGNEYHGPTNITYRFTEPPLDRKTIDLPVPVYKCMGNGIVEVRVTVDQMGNVTSARASVITASTDPDCLSEVAEKYARRTEFTGDISAPASQQAVITYQFVAQ